MPIVMLLKTRMIVMSLIPLILLLLSPKLSPWYWQPLYRSFFVRSTFLSPINPKIWWLILSDFRRFTLIDLKFKIKDLQVLNFKTICVNLFVNLTKYVDPTMNNLYPTDIRNSIECLCSLINVRYKLVHSEMW